jgi:hypothetical protein
MAKPSNTPPPQKRDTSTQSKIQFTFTNPFKPTAWGWSHTLFCSVLLYAAASIVSSLSAATWPILEVKELRFGMPESVHLVPPKKSSQKLVLR